MLMVLAVYLSQILPLQLPLPGETVLLLEFILNHSSAFPSDLEPDQELDST